MFQQPPRQPPSFPAAGSAAADSAAADSVDSTADSATSAARPTLPTATEPRAPPRPIETVLPGAPPKPHRVFHQPPPRPPQPLMSDAGKFYYPGRPGDQCDRLCDSELLARRTLKGNRALPCPCPRQWQHARSTWSRPRQHGRRDCLQKVANDLSDRPTKKQRTG